MYAHGLERMSSTPPYPKGHGPPDLPGFSPYAVDSVEVEGLTGSWRADNASANLEAGSVYTPDGYTWHHVEDGVTMQLVPKDLHDAAHTGGAAVIRHGEVQ